MIKIAVEGLQDAMNFIKKKAEGIEKGRNDGVHKAGFFIEGEVKKSISGRSDEKKSVDTGAFLNSVHTDNSKDFESTVSDGVPYGIYLEYGTSKIDARSHFGNSLNRNQEKIQEIIKKEIENKLYSFCVYY